MSVDNIVQAWIDAGRGDECFWEGWPECPTPEDELTPNMIRSRIEALEHELSDERALCDRLRNAATSIGVTNIPWREADAAYRKARGM